MAEYSSLDEADIADDLLDLIPRLLREIRADIPREASAEQVIPELHDISELRATTGQIRLLRIVITHQRCTMQELAEQLDVAAPTVTAMVKRLLSQGFVERLRDEQDWRVVRVLPTERGQRALTLYDQFRRANLRRRLAQLSQEELALLRLALPVLHHIVEVEP
ncbi:MAG: MarR family transcriptional regulator [Chloroflexi bacterium]|nr:MAG: MarR family transcriptional regulator [Chloroflexota bacterium]TMD74097.1 MAG: MarR family transcriptional regulator [Chloroflexota bacterium]